MNRKKLLPILSAALFSRLVLAASPSGPLQLSPDRPPAQDFAITSGRESTWDWGIAELGEEMRSAYDTLFLELGGAGLILSVNYDRIFGEHLSLRAGFGLMAVGEGERVHVFPIGANYLLGPGDHKLELGVTVTVALEGGGKYFPLISPGMGYRFAPKSGGLSYRAVVSPVFTQSGAVYPFGGVSIGLQF